MNKLYNQIFIGAIGYDLMMCRHFCDLASQNRANKAVHHSQLTVAKYHAKNIKLNFQRIKSNN